MYWIDGTMNLCTDLFTGGSVTGMADILLGDSVCVFCDRHADAAAVAPGGRPRQDVDVRAVGGVRCRAHGSLDHHDGGAREPHSVGESLGRVGGSVKKYTEVLPTSNMIPFTKISHFVILSLESVPIIFLCLRFKNKVT